MIFTVSREGRKCCDLPNLGKSFTTSELYQGKVVSDIVHATLQHQAISVFSYGKLGGTTGY